MCTVIGRFLWSTHVFSKVNASSIYSHKSTNEFVVNDIIRHRKTGWSDIKPHGISKFFTTGTDLESRPPNPD